MVASLQSLPLRIQQIIRCWVQGSWRTFTSTLQLLPRWSTNSLPGHEALGIILPFPTPFSSHPGLYSVFSPHCLLAHSWDAWRPLFWTFPTPPCRSSFYSFQCLLNQIKASAPGMHSFTSRLAPWCLLPSHGSPVYLLFLICLLYSCACFWTGWNPQQHWLLAKGPKGESTLKSACL